MNNRVYLSPISIGVGKEKTSEGRQYLMKERELRTGRSIRSTAEKWRRDWNQVRKFTHNI